MKAHSEELDFAAPRFQILAQIPRFSRKTLGKFSGGSNCALKMMARDTFFVLCC